MFQLVCLVAGVLTSGYLRTGTLTSTTLTGALVAATSYTAGLVLWEYVRARCASAATPTARTP